MPSTNYEPRACLMSDFDAREWSGVNVFDRGGDSVTLPTFDPAGLTGIYPDVLSFLNGRGRAPTVNMTGLTPAAWVVSLSNADRVTVTNTSGVAFTVAPKFAGFHAFGFTETVSSVTVGGTEVATANADWTRGLIFRGTLAGHDLRVEPDVGADLDIIGRAYTASSVVEMIRAYSTADADGGWSAEEVLEDIDNEAADSGSGAQRITWGLTDDGHVFSSWTTAGSIDPVTWVSATFRDRLGFSGLESPVTNDGRVLLVADYPCPGVFVTVEPLTLPPLDSPVEDSSTLALSGGGYTSTLWRRARRWDVGFYVDGPASATPQVRHYVDRVLPYLSRGRPLTVYPEWGDPRRRLDPMSVTASVPAYSLLHTSQAQGERGRIVGAVAESNAPARGIEWPAQGIRTRALQSWTVEEV